MKRIEKLLNTDVALFSICDNKWGLRLSVTIVLHHVSSCGR